MKIQLIALLLLCVWVSAEQIVWAKGLAPRLGISPQRLEVYPEEKSTGQSITVLNLSSEVMNVEVSVQNWDFDENNKYRALAPSPQSLDQWIVINPVRLEIPAKSQQTVRLAIRPRAVPVDGEHRAMIFFKEVPKKNPGAKGQFNFNVGVPIYAYFGDVKRSATVHRIDYDEKSQALLFDLTNTGNAYVRPEGVYEVFAAKDLKSNAEILGGLSLDRNKIPTKRKGSLAKGRLAVKPVLADARRVLDNKLKLGELDQAYALGVKVDIGGKVYQRVFRVAKSSSSRSSSGNKPSTNKLSLPKKKTEAEK